MLPIKHKNMYPKPIDEYKLLQSLPGFDELNDEEKLKFRITSFEYKDYQVLTVATLLFTYDNIPLRYSLSCSRQEGCCFQNVLYGEDYDEKEFSSFRKAIDFCNENH